MSPRFQAAACDSMTARTAATFLSSSGDFGTRFWYTRTTTTATASSDAEVKRYFLFMRARVPFSWFARLRRRAPRILPETLAGPVDAACLPLAVCAPDVARRPDRDGERELKAAAADQVALVRVEAESVGDHVVHLFGETAHTLFRLVETCGEAGGLAGDALARCGVFGQRRVLHVGDGDLFAPGGEQCEPQQFERVRVAREDDFTDAHLAARGAARGQFVTAEHGVCVRPADSEKARLRHFFPVNQFEVGVKLVEPHAARKFRRLHGQRVQTRRLLVVQIRHREIL